MISIIIPFLSTPYNDQAIEIVKETLADNTVGEYELLIDSREGCPYDVINQVAEDAKSDWLLFSNSDVFFAPNWDVAMWESRRPKAITTGYLVECGAIGVASENIHRDFGWRPESFDRAGFESFAAEHGQTVPEVEEKRGWYFPCLIHRDYFRELGKFDTSRGRFPAPLDIFFWEKHLEAGGALLVARSYFYHLQALTDADRVDRTDK